MDKSLIKSMKDKLNIKDVDARNYSPLTLAYIGDAVYEVIIRTILVSEANMAVKKYHHRASHLVNAGYQAELIHKLEPILTDEEMSVYRRGRNAKSYTSSKNASVIEYRTATGFEALIGYLYLKEEIERIYDLLRFGLEIGE